MAIEIIGAGVGRTGTHSLKKALERLGYAKCYHMEDLVMHHPEKMQFWNDLRAGHQVDWDSFFAGYRAAVDFPVFRYYKEFMQRYPDARVILTVRDPESWYASFERTIIRQSQPTLRRKLAMAVKLPFNRKLRRQLGVFKFSGAHLKEFFPGGFHDKDAAIRFVSAWNEEVKRTVPQEKLLVFNVREGWKPLCAFLGVPIPDDDFPHSNTSAEFNSRKL